MEFLKNVYLTIDSSKNYSIKIRPDNEK